MHINDYITILKRLKLSIYWCLFHFSMSDSFHFMAFSIKTLCHLLLFLPPHVFLVNFAFLAMIDTLL